jgi:hypothetical protein
LQKQHHRQNGDVTVAGDESFHGITVSGFWFPVSKARPRLVPVVLGGELGRVELETRHWEP